MAFKFNEHFNSSAKITYLNQFRFGQLEFDNPSASWQGHNYVREHDYYPKFPVLIQSNGLPWDIANSYLMSLVQQKQPWEMESVNTRAKGLLAYLRFLEHSNLNFLHLPKNNRQKAPYRFRAKLSELIYEGLSVSYAANCIRAVIDFYKHIVKWKLLNPEMLENSPYQTIESLIAYISGDGFSRIKKIEAADISIKIPAPQVPVDRIKDGGILRPLSIAEQRVLKTYIDSPDSNTALSLLIKIAVTTGARLQTICTIRNHHIDYLCSELESRRKAGKARISIELNTGRFRDIDTKNGTSHKLLFSPDIIECLYIYSISEVHEKRMFVSYYGKTRNNYLFLTRDGNPFYTSKKEILERQKEVAIPDINIKKFIIKTGGSVDKLLKNLVKSMLDNHVEVKSFRIHDLRATFGMNLVRRLSASGISGIKLLITVRDRMGHKDISVTQRYLDFDEMLSDMETTTELYEKNLFGEY
ncbi:hypothetical protein ACED29_17265 [Shewanella sp. 5S214]|uniref:hypothetical protein n=1 Tax=Shewanella sp. 5S214 TaxID=3229999 RepID=UPI00352E2DA4